MRLILIHLGKNILSSSMPKEAQSVFMKLTVSYSKLADAIEEGDRASALRALRECTMFSYKFLSMVPGMSQLSTTAALSEDDFKKLKDLCK